MSSVGQIRAFRPLGNNRSQALAVTSANQNIALNDTPSGTRSIRVVNAGTDTIFIEFSTGAGTATTTTSMPMLANSVEVFLFQNDKTHISVIGATGGLSNIYITYGEGL